MRYKVLKDFVSRSGKKVFHAGEEAKLPKDTNRISALRKYGFIEPIKQDYSPSIIATSKLAKVYIAGEDYTEGDKKHFTWKESCAIEGKLANGWRLPTRSEWVLICEEFGQKDGALNADTLMESLGLVRGGWVSSGSLSYVDSDGAYWSQVSNSSSHAYSLYFGSSGVYPSDYSEKEFGLSVRLVRDVKEEGE